MNLLIAGKIICIVGHTAPPSPAKGTQPDNAGHTLVRQPQAAVSHHREQVIKRWQCLGFAIA